MSLESRDVVRIYDNSERMSVQPKITDIMALHSLNLRYKSGTQTLSELLREYLIIHSGLSTRFALHIRAHFFLSLHVRTRHAI